MYFYLYILHPKNEEYPIDCREINSSRISWTPGAMVFDIVKLLNCFEYERIPRRNTKNHEIEILPRTISGYEKKINSTTTNQTKSKRENNFWSNFFYNKH